MRGNGAQFELTVRQFELTVQAGETVTGRLFSAQNEKCHLLIEHETQKLKELDEEHSQELREWREKLRPRKKVREPGSPPWGVPL